MSTLRVDTLETVDGSYTINVQDIASLAPLAASTGATLVGYNATTVAGQLTTNTNSISSLQAQVDEINTTGDGLVSIDTYLASGETYYDNAIQLALAAAKIAKTGIRFGPKEYRFQNPVTLNMPQTGISLIGAGEGQTVLYFPNALAGQTQLIVRSAADWYNFKWERMSVRSSHAGVLCQIGSNELVDPLNLGLFIDLAFLNGFVSENAKALVVNYCVNSNWIGCRANCSANGTGANYGDALTCNLLQFNAFMSCSFGNASYGIKFMNSNNTGNVFNAVDIENVNIGIYSGTTSNQLNTFVGGQYSLWTQYMVQAPLGYSEKPVIRIIDGHYSNAAGWPTTIVDPGNAKGVYLSGVQGMAGSEVTTPTMPGSGTNYRNATGQKVKVYIWGGSVSSVNINGFGIGLTSGMFELMPWDTISISYSSTPNWLWKVGD